MVPMIFEHFAGKDICFTAAEVQAAFAQAVNGVNTFNIYTDVNVVYPYLSVMVNGDCAYIWYAPDEESAGFQVYGDDLELDSEGSTVFYLTTPTEEMQVPNDYVCSKETALQVVLDFMKREDWPTCYEELPDCVEWEEL